MKIKNLYENIFNLLPGTHLIIGENNNIVNASHSSVRMSQVWKMPVVGKSLADIYSEKTDPDNLGKLISSLNIAKNDKKTNEIEIKILLSDHGESFKKTEKILKITHVPLEMENKILHVVDDLTEYRKIQKIQNQEHQLTEGLITQAGEMEHEISGYIEMARLKNQFIANISHEFRTPIHGILGFARLLLKNTPSYQQKEFLEHILNCGNNLNSMVNDVLDIAKMEAGKTELKITRIDVRDLIKEVESIFHSILLEKKILFKTHYDDFPGYIDNDFNKLKQIVFNYVSNAIKFSHIGGTVTVSIQREPNDMFRISVADTGPGIHKSDICKLFVEFQQLDDSITKGYQGAGLGLAIVKKLTTLLGGNTGVVSEPRKGSTFYVTFPCHINL